MMERGESSWNDMLDSALMKMSDASIAVINADVDFAKDVLAAEERQTLKHIREFLKSFSDTIQEIECWHTTLYRVLPTMDPMTYQFTIAIKQCHNNFPIRASLQTGCTSLPEYSNMT